VLCVTTACFYTIDESKLFPRDASTDTELDEDGATACGSCDCLADAECKYAVENGASVDVETGAHATLFGGPGALDVRCHERSECTVFLGTGSSTIACATGATCNVVGGGGQSSTRCEGNASCDVECHDGPCSLSCDTATCVAHKLGSGTTNCTGASASCP